MIRNVEIYLEGYHDRAFMDGWLRHRGWRSPGIADRRAVTNPVTGRSVAGGRYGLTSPRGDTFVELIPLRGDADLLAQVASRVKRATPPDPHDIVVVLDVDDDDCQTGSEKRRQSLDGRLRGYDATVSRHSDVWTLSGGLRVHLLLWACDQSVGVGVPRAHTLERIVCAALSGPHPERGAAVQTWLDGRPDATRTSAKSYSWSYMAGWAADLGCEAFLSELWQDAEVAEALGRIFASSGAEATIRDLEEGPTVPSPM